MLVANAFSGVLTLLLCIAAGAVAAKLKYINEDIETKLSKFTLHFSVPCLLFLNCLNYISRELIENLGFILLIPGLIIPLTYALGFAAGKLFKVPRENFGLFCVTFSMSNTIFIGLPVCLAIFGEEALPLVAAYFPFNTLAFWTLGAIGIAADAKVAFKPGLDTFKKILSPPLVGALLGGIFALTDVTLPTFVTDAMRHMGNMTTPVALILAGCTVSRMGSGVLRMTREGALTLAGRFILSPLIALGLCLAAGAPVLVTRVYTLEAAMPVMSQSMLLARTYGANHRFAAQMITLTTIIGLLYVPLLIFILEKIT